MSGAGAALQQALAGGAGGAALLAWLASAPAPAHTQEVSMECDLFNCSRSEFVTYFLSFLRTQTESILQTNSNALQILQHQSTPEKLLSQKKMQLALANVAQTPDTVNQNNHSVRSDQRTQQSPTRDRSSTHKKPGRRVKTKLFNEHDTRKSESDEPVGFKKLAISSSTPLKSNADFPHLPITSPVMPNMQFNATERASSRNSSKLSNSDSSRERCDTPRITHSRNSRSSEKSVSLADFMTNATKVGTKKKKTAFKNTSNDTAESLLDLSNDAMFPDLGAKRNRSSVEKRRIKPTNIDDSLSSSSKSFTINSFNSESFQQPPTLALEENQAFKQQKFLSKEHSNSFDTERNLLKQERHKLMEKFNILNTSNTTKTCPTTPQIKIFRKDSIEKTRNLIDADPPKIVFKDKLETLVEIYNVLLKNNLVLSVSGEIYFLISIVLSKQCSEDYAEVENKLKGDNNYYILRSLHNCSYFAIKTLWLERDVLEVMLDKFSLKLLGENKRVRAFYPDLAKFLLNLYSLKCESDLWGTKDENGVVILENRFTNGIVCFNSETDNADNFANLMSFQNFKKQRDMFYEILRWWSDSSNHSIGSARASLRSRVKSLLTLAISPSNHAHLARLVTSHMLAECISSNHESKMSKLQRRLTGAAPTPASAESHRLPRFSGREEFYRDFLSVAESEGFRAHMRDSLASEIVALDAGCLPSCEERANSSCAEIRHEYLSSVKRLRLLAKFLGYLVSLPYQPASPEYHKTVAAVPQTRLAAKDNILQSEIALRNHSQPPMDLIYMLNAASEQSRLCVTIPWLIQYLAMLDCAGLRIRYYDRLLKIIFNIYANLHVADEEYGVKKCMIIFLKLCLGWLFELPHFPQESFYENVDISMSIRRSVTDSSVDFADVIDENVLTEVCPYLKEFNALLLTSHPCNDMKDANSSYRHITPVTMSINAADRAKTKERELQARLEEELIRGQPSSTRRVLELVADRVTSATVKELASTLLVSVRARCRAEAQRLVQAWRDSDTSQLLKQLQQLYRDQLTSLRQAATDLARRSIEQRSDMALQALLAGGTACGPLETVVRRVSQVRVAKWLDDNCGSVAILCKDIEMEMDHLLMLGESLLPSDTSSSAATITQLLLPNEQFEAGNVSAAELIMEMRDTICLLLDYNATQPLPPLLDKAHICCCPENVFITATSRRAIMQLSVDIAVVYVSREPSNLTEQLLQKFHTLWDRCCPDRQKNTQPNDSTQEEPYDPRNFLEREPSPLPISSDEEEDGKPKRIIVAQNYVVINKEDFNKLQIDLRNPGIGASKSEVDCESDARSSGIDSRNLGMNARNLGIDARHLEIDSRNLKIDARSLEIDARNLGIDASKTDMKKSKSDNGIIKSPDIFKFENVTPISKDTTPNVTQNGEILDGNTSKVDSNENLLDFFERIICPRNMVMLSESRVQGGAVWEAMARLLIFLLRNNFLTEDSLTEQCLAVYRHDWPQAVLEGLSRCTRAVSTVWGSTGKFTLFLDFLAEYCSEMDYETDHIDISY